MRVALNTEQLLYRAPGGTGRYTAQLVKLLPRVFPGDSVLPLTASHPPAAVAAAFEAFGLTGSHVERPVILRLPRPILYEAWHLLRAPSLEWMAPSVRSADLVHAPSPAVPPRGGRPLVVTVHDVAFKVHPEAYPPRGRWFHERGVAAAARRADLVITGTEAAAEEIAALTAIAPGRLRVVPYGVDDVRATPGETEEALSRFGLSDKPYVLWVGSLEPRKNVGTLVRAFARLVADPAVAHRLVLVGPVGWLTDGLVPAGEQRQLGDRLRTVGQVSESDLRSLYAGADVFAFPSLHEGFGLPVLEAMTQGTAVICSDIPSLREVVARAAVLVPPRDVRAWVDALADVLGSPASRASLGSAGREHARSFSWDRMVIATRAVYAEALGSTS